MYGFISLHIMPAIKTFLFSKIQLENNKKNAAKIIFLFCLPPAVVESLEHS